MCFLQLVERTGAAGTGVPAAGSWAAGCASPSTAVLSGRGSARWLSALQRPSPRRGCATPFSASHLLAVPLRWLPVGLVTPCPRFAPAQPPSLPAPGAVVSQAPAPAGGCRAGVSAEVSCEVTTGGGRDSPASLSPVLGVLRVLRAGAHCRLSAQSLMAGSCEISNIFSNYISAMYQPDEVQPTLDMLGHLGDDSTLGLSLPTSQPPAQSTDKPEWFSELPYFWTKVQVLEWISYHVEKNKYDASSIDFSCCNMDGHALCHCTRDQMRLIFGPLGDELYDRLHEITSDELNWIIDLLEKEDATSQETFLDSSHLELGNPCAKDSLEDMKPTNPFLSTDFTCLPGAMSPGSSDVSGPVMSHSPNSQDSGGSDLDLDPAEAKLFPDNGFAGSKKGDSKHGKRKRGRPRKLSKETRDCLESRKSKHSPRGTHLWEFIRDILIHPELNEGLMKWEDRREGVFKFLRSEAVAQLWGQKKKNSSMTYEKLSRAMRYYYKREILERVDGRRLVYKFGKNSSGWKEEEVLNRNKEL